MITILDEWLVVDRWWTDKPIRTSYKEVIWNGRILTFKQSFPEKIWRVFKC